MNFLRLINCDQELLQKILAGNTALAEHLAVKVPEQWSEFGAPAFQYTLDRLAEDPGAEKWWTYLAIHLPSNTLVGSGGFKGRPSPEGSVEIGYEIAESYRRQGLATELAQLLLEWALAQQEVTSVLAHTLAEENASVRVLRKCGFQLAEEIVDKEEGAIWKWEYVSKQ
jgi:RimJ/RimL family protein N-acetyltransferase